MIRPIPYNGNENYIFISYSHRDMAEAIPIISQLQKDGFRVWYDEGIDPGTEWDEFIATKVNACSYFIALLSNNYIASQNCKDELNFARDLDKNRLLVYLSATKLPIGMQMRLNRLQSISYYAYEDKRVFFDKLRHANLIESCLDNVPTTPSLPSPQPIEAEESIPEEEPEEIEVEEMISEEEPEEIEAEEITFEEEPEEIEAEEITFEEEPEEIEEDTKTKPISQDDLFASLSNLLHQESPAQKEEEAPAEEDKKEETTISESNIFSVLSSQLNKFEIEKGVLVKYNTNESSVIIPNNITEIAAYAFDKCTDLIFISIPSNVKKINKGAFRACKKLTSVTLDKSTKAEEGAFPPQCKINIE